MKISRIRLSDKTSRLHPRHVVPKPAQAHGNGCCDERLHPKIISPSNWSPSMLLRDHTARNWHARRGVALSRA